MLVDLEAQFQRLAAGPKTLAVDDRRIGHGLPPRWISLGELRAMLLAPAAERTLKDAVWRVLVQYARTEGGDWVAGCVGMALPGLRAAAVRATACSSERIADDIVSELLTEFLTQLPRVDLGNKDVADPAGVVGA